MNFAFVGVSKQAEAAHTGCGDENFVALCDVNDKCAAEVYAKHPGTRRFKDFRLMLKMHRDIDAIVVSISTNSLVGMAIEKAEIQQRKNEDENEKKPGHGRGITEPASVESFGEDKIA